MTTYLVYVKLSWFLVLRALLYSTYLRGVRIFVFFTFCKFNLFMYQEEHSKLHTEIRL